MQQTVERPLSHRAIAAEVLGVSVRLTSSAELARFKNYVPSLGVKSYHQRSHDREMAMALPDDGVLMTFVIDSAGGVYSHIANCPDYLFTVQQCWQCLSDIFDVDSVVHGLVYKSGANETVLGIFDASKIHGDDLQHDSFMQRHVRVFDILKQQTQLDRVQYHWAGYASACYDSLRQKAVPFASHQILLLRPDFSAQRIIGPVST
jgi:hypothetical protein